MQWSIIGKRFSPDCGDRTVFLMHRARGVLIDLNGTLHVDDKAIGQSVAALKALRRSNIPLRFVSNTSKQSRSSLLELVRSIGFEMEDDELFTSLSAVRSIVNKKSLNPLLLLSENAKSDFEMKIGPFDSVVVGLGKYYYIVSHFERFKNIVAPEEMTYGNMDKAFNVLLRGGPLIAAHKGRYLKAPDGLSIEPGAFVSALEFASGASASVIGKPSSTFFETVIDSFGLAESSTGDFIMIGDDVVDDALAAKQLGLISVLVQSGKYLPGDETKYKNSPDFVCKDFEHFVTMYLNTKSHL